MDTLALNYDVSLNTNNVYIRFNTDDDAINFNFNANTDDGTCKLSS